MVQIQVARLQDLLPAEREQLPGQRRGALARLAHLIELAKHRIALP